MSKPSNTGAWSTQPPKPKPPYLQTRFPRAAFVARKISTSNTGRRAAKAWAYRRPILFGLVATYSAVTYAQLKADAYLRDFVYPDTYLVWKIYDGSIVESRGPPNISALLAAPAAGEESPKTMEMFEIIKSLKWAQGDERIKGIFADFSGLHLPSSVTPNRLGMAQIEELMTAIHEFQLAKKAQFGEQAKPSIAWADTFSSQGSYLLASAFDELYIQPTGSIPLTGLGSQIPFFKKALEYFGIKVQADARREYKSMISTFSQEEGLPPAQLQNQAELLGDLNRNMVHTIAANRFSDQLDRETRMDKVQKYSEQGPFSAREAKEMGLIDGVAFKRELVKKFVDPKHGGSEDTKFKTLHHYHKVQETAFDRALPDDQKFKVGVVYLLGTISNAPGEFSTSSVLKGLKEAAEDEDTMGVVLRIDSGGGDVVASESIWDAVRRVREDYGKPVVASFGNAAASGGYYAASAADFIVANENTVTGSIGVASLRPTITRAFFDRFNIGIQSFFTGSTSQSSLHELSDAQRARASRHIDEMYSDFLQKVCDGRGISRDIIESLAGGRVMTGFSAWARCNQEKDVPTYEYTPAKEVIDQGSADAAKNGTLTLTQVKLGSFLSQWMTKSITASSGNNTIRIERNDPNKASAASFPSDDGDIRSLTSDLIAKAEDALKSGTEKIRSEIQSQGDVGEQSQLADSAHSTAEYPHSRGPPVWVSKRGVQKLEKQDQGPYGRGLVDAIGGLHEGARCAMELSLQSAIHDLIVKDGLTQEQAINKLRPGCECKLAEDGSFQLQGDLRLVRFPEEKPFWKRLQERNARGDEPQLSLLPSVVSNTIALMLEEAGNKAAKAAVRMMIATASDPSGIASAFEDPQLVEKLRQNNGAGWGNGARGRARAEYPFASFFS